MNENEIGRIAAAVNALRPDWPAASLVTFITKNLAARPRRDVALALTWIACDSKTMLPGRVLEAGPWWRAAAVEGATSGVRYPKPHEVCGKHPGQFRLSCSGCATDARACDVADDLTVTSVDRGSAVSAARAALSTAKNATTTGES